MESQWRDEGEGGGISRRVGRERRNERASARKRNGIDEPIPPEHARRTHAPHTTHNTRNRAAGNEEWLASYQTISLYLSGIISRGGG